jgi:hypothetical protein
MTNDTVLLVSHYLGVVFWCFNSLEIHSHCTCPKSHQLTLRCFSFTQVEFNEMINVVFSSKARRHRSSPGQTQTWDMIARSGGTEFTISESGSVISRQTHKARSYTYCPLTSTTRFDPSVLWLLTRMEMTVFVSLIMSEFFFYCTFFQHFQM